MGINSEMVSPRSKVLLGIATLSTWLSISAPAFAQSESTDATADSELSADEIARELTNPNATLGFLSVSTDYIAYQGSLPSAGSQSAWKVAFQPSLPYPLSDDTNLFVRPFFPVYLDQPVPVVADQPIEPPPGTLGFAQTGTELGDIGFDVAIGKTLAGGTVLFGGVVGSLPTATDDSLSLNQYLLGPEVYVGKVADWGAIGLLLTHQWDIGGSNKQDTSITGGQYFFTYNLENAWQIQMTPTFSYNHNAESGDELTFPLAIGASRTVKIGKTPWKFHLQYWHYIESGDLFGPDYQLRFTATPVVPLPW